MRKDLVHDLEVARDCYQTGHYMYGVINEAIEAIKDFEKQLSDCVRLCKYMNAPEVDDGK